MTNRLTQSYYSLSPFVVALKSHLCDLNMCIFKFGTSHQLQGTQEPMMFCMISIKPGITKTNLSYLNPHEWDLIAVSEWIWLMSGPVPCATLLHCLIFLVSTTFIVFFLYIYYIWSLTALAYNSLPMYRKEQHEHFTKAKHLFLRYTEDTHTSVEYESR